MRLLALVLLLATQALAFPRVGLHENFTRLVFDLPPGASYEIHTEGQTLSLRFRGVKAEVRDESVNSDQVASYQVVIKGAVVEVFVRLRAGMRVQSSVLNDPQGKRLIVDITQSEAEVASAPQTKPAPAKSPPKPAQPRFVVVIDPGHGGRDPGAVAPCTGLTEKLITLDVSWRMKRYLEAQGVQVVLTRSDDTYPTLDDRAQMADSKKNLFISVHVNSTAGCPGQAQGIETYYFGELLNPSLLEQVIRENGGGAMGQQLTRVARSAAQRAASDILAQLNLRFSRELAYAVQRRLVQATGAVDRGVQQAPFYVLRNARIPAILVEIGFANHATEGRRLADPGYRETIARAMGQAVTGFLGVGSVAQR
jgi:N-acetylmuramoyl-L-alanine amidase